jgi:Binding-protein-dependent transport system inner membrane component
MNSTDALARAMTYSVFCGDVRRGAGRRRDSDAVRPLPHARRRPVSHRYRHQDNTDRGHRTAAGDLAWHRLVVEDRRGDSDLLFSGPVNTVKGLKAPDIEYRELFGTLGASRAQEFRKLRIPYCLPYLFSALKILSSLAVIGAIVGEFVGAMQGLGHLIIVPSATLRLRRSFRRSPPPHLPASPCSTQFPSPNAD